MVVFPNCKINLGLTIIRKRDDGYHDLETVFYPLPLKEMVEITPAPEATEANIEFSASGNPVEGKPEDNLCWRAYYLLKKDFPLLPPIKMHLHKAIPSGAGLGGGSADGAAVLKMLNEKFKLQLSREQLIAYALQLGSDCPFFIVNKPCLATSRGEQLEEIRIDLAGYNFFIVNPGIHVSTARAFSMITPGPAAVSIKEIIARPVETWHKDLKNDFEKPVFVTFPEIKAIKDTLYAAGALYAAMSGSGSTVFGIFPKDQTFSFHFPGHYFTKTLSGQTE
ncbi:MAG TPA: 4-(cytidine 5'-diphospho)-2-C-methyl-D-erythritol kinase [Chitinophagaceae bacterium]|nr:4-(cytidine 5'-diphospho)-2-C-methyl-D-erythritol kinase [Chitinophagaceae bacterium]